MLFAGGVVGNGSTPGITSEGGEKDGNQVEGTSKQHCRKNKRKMLKKRLKRMWWSKKDANIQAASKIECEEAQEPTWAEEGTKGELGKEAEENC